MKKNITAAACYFALCALFANPCYAIDGASFELGTGDNADMWRIGLMWNWKRKWLVRYPWHVGAYWDAQLGQWGGSGKRTVTDLGLTPVFRLQQTSPSAISPYLEAGVGFHLISPTSFDDQRHFSSAFQFGDLVGVGARFGEHGRFDLSLRFQHLSNGGIKEPNDGVNFVQARFLYHFD
jgi:hypothetical protein